MIRFAAAANVSLMAYGVLHGTIDPSDPAVAAVAASTTYRPSACCSASSTSTTSRL